MSQKLYLRIALENIIALIRYLIHTVKNKIPNLGVFFSIQLSSEPEELVVLD